MIFGIVLALMAAAAAAFVTIPLLRARASLPAQPTSLPSKSGATRPGTILWFSAGLVCAVSLPAIGLYASIGRPDLATIEARVDQISQSSVADASPGASMTGMIADLKSKVGQNPKDAGAWQNLGWAFMHIHQPADALEAYSHAVSLAPRNWEYRSALAEATIQAGSGKISDETVADLRAVVASDPADARARFYLALYKDQQGDHQGAIRDWIDMIKSAPADATWTVEVRRVVEEVAREEHIDVAAQLPPDPQSVAVAAAPDAQQMAAANQMPADDRSAMIHSMVEKLAAELKQNPHDAEGWQRLMRARMVLGEKAQAAAAYRNARSAFAPGSQQLAALDAVARDLGILGDKHG